MHLSRLVPWNLSVSILLCFATSLAVQAQSTAPNLRVGAHRTALDNYVAAPDDTYQWSVVTNISGGGGITTILELTSQNWLTSDEVDRTLWKHWLIVARPASVNHSNALLFITGGANNGKLPKGPDGNMARIALQTKSIVAELKMVPNQPLVFAGETEGRTEDSLIAYTWDKFLRTGDPKWPARLPMTKSAVRAMDAVTEFCASDEGGNVALTGFVVAGGSKRGWTTWATAAVDKRVVAIVPIVIDVLNVVPSMLHHYGAYGFWAPAIQDYVDFRIMDWTGTPEYAALMKIEDPYEYRDRFTMPKFILNASGDQFFLPDSSKYYFDDLPGLKYLRYVPNADHSLRNSDAFQSLLAFYNATLKKSALPRFTWTKEKDGAIRVTAVDKPSQVKLWQATNANARDFRLETLGPVWESTTLKEQDGAYTARVKAPEKGWSAFFVELTYPSGIDEAPFKFTTSVTVLPDTEPFRFEPKAPRR